MVVEALIEQLLQSRSPLDVLTEPLSPEVAAIVVEHLKQAADQHWTINANRSLEIAEIIVQIGRMRDDLRQVALGIMARGNALAVLGHTHDAWNALDQAGSLFQQAHDDVGWARTRIGMVGICIDLKRVEQALADAARARQILSQRHEYEKLLRLDVNEAILYHNLGDHHKALTLYNSALGIAANLGEMGQGELGPLYINAGVAYEFLGELRQAAAHYEQARHIFAARNEISGVAVAEMNIAYLAQAQGQYRQALNLLHHAFTLLETEQLAFHAAQVKRTMIECHLLLNRHQDARELCLEVIPRFRELGAAREEALTHLLLATAEAQLNNLAAAQTALDAADTIFGSLGAETRVAAIRLRRSRIALEQGDSARAKREALAAAACFEGSGQSIDHARATLLLGQAAFAEGNLSSAAEASTVALRIAQRSNVPPLRYAAHLLLGHIAEDQGALVRAARHYYAALTTVERVQRRLTITLRPGFLEDKADAQRALIALHLRTGSVERAFETLERAKSHVLLNYLSNREQLHWSRDDQQSSLLIEELARLRKEHQWFYHLAHEAPEGEQRETKVAPEQARTEVAWRERRMRAISEQLYLRSKDGGVDRRAQTPTLRDIQNKLTEQSILIEYYNDGHRLWAFTVEAQRVQVHALEITVQELDRLLANLRLNIAAALQTAPRSPAVRALTIVGQRIFQKLYDGLLRPLGVDGQRYRRLMIVPYGALHYLPFHLLHSGTRYLIDESEVVVLPTAGLALQRSPVRKAGARVLAHSWNERLPQTQAEAQLVQHLFGGEIYAEQDATRSVLQAQPTQILHIAAHGEHRLDQPDLSYIQLADGQTYTDDLLQYDLSYELVTLSACETGRANVAAGDELIGLGRGFLYAGAGALIASMWRVADDTTVVLMEHVYRALHNGASKAAALREAQQMLLEQQLHPAFWGAFQCVGNAEPLSTSSR